MSDSLSIALIGCGQIGGSLALALQLPGEDLRITGFDVVAKNAEILQRMGAINRVAESAIEAVCDADIVILAMPLRSYASVAKTIAPHLKPGAIVSDVGSVKRTMEALSPLLPVGVALVPAHPISGSERTGPEAARANLYQEKLCVLAPSETTDARAVSIIRSLWEMAGATVREMPVAVHDQLYAYVSHLPHAVAFVAAQAFHRLGARIEPADIILAKFLRISRSNPRMWSDVFIENREALLAVLDMYLAVLAHMAKELREGEAGTQGEAVSIAKAALPSILASALISTVSLYEQQSNVNARAFGAGGLRDIAAPAAEAPEAAAEFISRHAAQVAGLLEDTLALFAPLRAAIETADDAALLALLSAMQTEAAVLSS